MNVLTAIGRFGLGVAFPGYCLLCADRLDYTRRSPLCPRCEETLPVIAGILCQRCGKPLISELSLCMRCRIAPYNFDSLRAIHPYREPITSLISAYKSYGRKSLARFFAGEIFSVYRRHYADWRVVPVPPRPGKIRKKGWDQVDEICKSLAVDYGLPSLRLLARKPGGIQQKTLNHDERAKNIEGKFYVKAGFGVPLKLVLLDDVFTTGATISACAAALKAHGAARVEAICLAVD